MRIFAVLGIHSALSTLFADDEAVDWMRGPHDAATFGGKRPIFFLTGGSRNGTMRVRRYLDNFLMGA